MNAHLIKCPYCNEEISDLWEYFDEYDKQQEEKEKNA
jgi:hypothetical protein